MSVSVENTSALGRKIEATISNQKFQRQVNDKITELTKKAKIKGFRPGKVPVSVIKKQYGPSVRQDVISDLIEETVKDVIVENKLKPAGQPVVEQLNDKEDADLSFTVTFEVFPEIELADLSESEIVKKTLTLSDADVEKMQKQLCDNGAKWLTQERPAKLGDRIVIDYVRRVEGGAEEEKKEGIQIELGSPSTLEGLSEPLVGASAGSQVAVDITYPEKWPEELVRGKKAHLEITLHEVKEKHPLEPNELAKEFSVDENDVQALHTAIKQRMEEEVARRLFEETQEQVLEILLEKNTFDIPAVLLQQEKDAILQEQKKQGNHHHDESDHVHDENCHHDHDEHSDSSTPEVDDMAIKRVKLGLLINKVIHENNLTVDPLRLKKEVAYMAQSFPNPEMFIEVYYQNKQLLAKVERVVLLQQAVEVLVGKVKCNEQAVSFDEIMNPTGEDAA